MDRRLTVAQAAAAAATLTLAPTIVLGLRSRVFVAIAVIETAVLAISTAYAVFIGLYRYPR